MVGNAVEVVPAGAAVTLVRYTASNVGAQYPRVENHLLWILLTRVGGILVATPRGIYHILGMFDCPLILHILAM